MVKALHPSLAGCLTAAGAGADAEADAVVGVAAVVEYGFAAVHGSAAGGDVAVAVAVVVAVVAVVVAVVVAAADEVVAAGQGIAASELPAAAVVVVVVMTAVEGEVALVYVAGGAAVAAQWAAVALVVAVVAPEAGAVAAVENARATGSVFGNLDLLVPCNGSPVERAPESSPMAYAGLSAGSAQDGFVHDTVVYPGKAQHTRCGHSMRGMHRCGRLCVS